MLLPYEDQNLFDEIRQHILVSLDPQGPLELHLAERAVCLLWRLRRIPTFEQALFEWGAADHADPMDLIIGDLDNDKSDIDLGHIVEALLRTDLISKLSRYEISLHKQLYQTLTSITDLKAARRVAANSPDL